MWKALINLIKRWLCKHDWEKLGEIELNIDDKNDISIGHRYYFVCKKCGKIKIRQ